MSSTEEPQISYEDLAVIEDEFDQIDSEIMRKQYELSKPAYAKRATALAKIPNFWPLVLEQAPMEIDQFIQTSDSRIFADSLTNIVITRPELESNPESGNPRSLKLRMEFKPNDDFEDTVLEKEFHYRRSKEGWTGLVSEPVKINWKKGKDLTEGLTDGAVALWEARKKKGDMRATDLPEYKSLAEKVEHLNGAGTSFFTWFGWVSGHRWISSEESSAANAEHIKKREARKNGTSKTEETEDEEEEEGDDGDEDVEVHEAGEMLAVSFADDLWPNAIKFFTQAQEMDEMSDIDFEEMDEDDEEEEGDEPIDIRSLVKDSGKGKRVSDVGPPSKKQKKSS